MTFGQNIPQTLRRHLLIIVWSSLVTLLLSLHVSEPYSRTVFTLAGNTHSLMRFDIFRADQTLLKLWNAWRALFIRALLTSSAAPTYFVLTLPNYEDITKSSIVMSLPIWVILSGVLLWAPMRNTLVFAIIIFRPTLFALIASFSVFCPMSRNEY